MQYRFAFLKTANDRFAVIVDSSEPAASGASETLTTFASEDVLVEQIVFADLDESTAADLISHVLLAAADRLPPNHWLTVKLSPSQLSAIGIAFPPAATPPRIPNLTDDPAFQRVLEEAPLGVATLAGPKHRITFINAAYARALGKSDADSLLGREAREALPELVGQPCFESLDKVYRTGGPHIGLGVKVEFRDGSSGRLEDTYFDFFYYPLHDQRGQITGVVCVARDVKDSVLAHQVSELRESQLFRQWAELEAIYQQSPMGMCLVDAKDFRIIRANDRQAKLLEVSTGKLLGKKLAEFAPYGTRLKQLCERAAAGEPIRNFEITIKHPSAPGALRTWLLTCTPIADARGYVETIAFNILELAGPPIGVSTASDSLSESDVAASECEAIN